MKTFKEWKNLHEHGLSQGNGPWQHAAGESPVRGSRLDRDPLPSEDREVLLTQLDDAARTADKMGLSDTALQLRKLVRTVISLGR